MVHVHSDGALRSSGISRGMMSIAFLYFLLLVNACADIKPTNIPLITQIDAKGSEVPIAEENLYTFEKHGRTLVLDKKAPTEVIFFAAGPPMDFYFNLSEKHPVEDTLIISVYPDHGELQWFADYGKKQYREKLTNKQVQTILKFIADNNVDKLPELGTARIIGNNKNETHAVDGINYVYVHLNTRSSRRVNINNPPRDESEGYAPDDPLWKYTKVVDFFKDLKNVDASPMPK